MTIPEIVYYETELPETEYLFSVPPVEISLLKQQLEEAVRQADSLGAHSFSLLPAQEPVPSRFFAVTAAMLRALTENRAAHPSLASIRFLCRDKAEAEQICRVYNFYYPETKQDRMQP